ncbi:MAG: hypothetical protein K6G03_06485 [Lachnospiraceae bacterium]|nr:hypothetical protein [Lachnospiraceae bacterium]
MISDKADHSIPDHVDPAKEIELLHSFHEAYKKMIVVVTHDMSIAEGAERVVRMEDGCILFRG